MADLPVLSSMLSRLFESSQYLDDVAVHHLVDALCRLSSEDMENASNNKVCIVKDIGEGEKRRVYSGSCNYYYYYLLFIIYLFLYNENQLQVHPHANTIDRYVDLLYNQSGIYTRLT